VLHALIQYINSGFAPVPYAEKLVLLLIYMRLSCILMRVRLFLFMGQRCPKPS